MSGKGPKSFDPEDEIHEYPILKEIQQWLKDIQKKMPDAGVNQWLKGEISLNCSAYRDWIKRKEKENNQDKYFPGEKIA